MLHEVMHSIRLEVNTLASELREIPDRCKLNFRLVGCGERRIQ